MSRIGRLPIEVPEGVEVAVKKNRVTVRGSKGELSRQFHPDIAIKLEGKRLFVSRPTDNRLHRSLHGLSRTLLSNMVKGVASGYPG